MLAGILGQRQITVPNQEIVLQLVNEDISLSDAQQTIAIVEQELQQIGVASIHVKEREDGKLVISYYSETDVEKIKALLLAQKDLAVGFVASNDDEVPVQWPSKDTSLLVYDLDVYEIQQKRVSFSSLGDLCAVELQHKNQRFVYPDFYPSFQESFSVEQIVALKANHRFPRYNICVKDRQTHKIPDVRAGPFS